VKAIPVGRGWFYEPKLDGYRGLVSRDGRGRPSVVSRNEKDLGRFFPELVDLAERLAPGTVLDGEIVSPADDGVSFTALQRRLMVKTSERRRAGVEAPAALLAFDLLHDHVSDLRKSSLQFRRRRLSAVVESVASPLLQLVTQTADPEAASAWLDDGLAMAGIEGVIAKRDEPYPRPNVKRWQKVRRLSTMDVLVEGFAGDPLTPRLVVGLELDGDVRILGTTLPLGSDDAARLAPLMPRAVAADRPLWSAFESHRYRSNEWFRIPSGLVAEIAYSHLDGESLRHSARFLRWRLSEPGIDTPRGSGP
jgi:ATP-dependent DNA ligase